ncbi:MAG: 5-formyltetrahydrofolate cyclo-ligase [Lachnospiraceae bacterium]|nr:5-formyltetrahydrofolate cyclo-ligase [Lachnospiraceae bacterium]
MDDKKAIRKRILKLRSSLTPLDVMRCSRAVIDKVIESEEYKSSKTIYTYFETENEISTHGLMRRAWKDGKKVAVPLCIGNRMEFIRINGLDSVMPGFKGIYEPFEGEVLEEDEVLMIMPGLAFDRSFNRIGYGGGYYDRYISEHPEVKFTLMALCYDFQILDEKLDVFLHDIPVDMIITPKNIMIR